MLQDFVIEFGLSASGHIKVTDVHSREEAMDVFYDFDEEDLLKHINYTHVTNVHCERDTEDE